MDGAEKRVAMQPQREGRRGGNAMAANAIIRVVFGDITFPLQKEEWRVGERERAKTANAGGMLKEEMSCLTYLL